MARKIKSDKSRWLHPVHSGVINLLDYYDKEKIEKLTAFIVKKFNVSRDWREPLRDMWIEHYQLYRGYSQYYESTPTWQSAYFINKCFEMVETVLPRIQGAIYDIPPRVVAIPQSPEFAEEASMSERLLETRATQTNQYFTDLITNKSTLFYGTGWQKLVYDISRNYEGTRWNHCDIFDVYPDPSRSEVPQMRNITHREVLHREELQLQEELGVWRGTKDVPAKGTNNYFSALDRLRSIGKTDRQESEMEDYHECLEYWGKWQDPDTKEWLDIVGVVVDRKYLVRAEECPYVLQDRKEGYWYAIKPFVKFIHVPVPGETYGIGIIEQMKQTNLVMNDLRNMKMDAIQFTVSPTYMVNSAALVDPNKVVFGPGEAIEVLDDGSPNDPVRPIRKDLSWTAAEGQEDRLDQEIRDVTGVQRPISGRETETRQTATQWVSALQEANGRFRLIVQILEQGPITEQAHMTYNMERQYTDEPVLAKLFSAKDVTAWAKITPTQLKGEFDMRLQPATQYGHKGLVAQQIKAFIEDALKIPGAIERLDVPKLMGKLLDAYDIKDKSLILQLQPAAPPQPMAGGNVIPMPGLSNPMGPAGIPRPSPTMISSPEEMAAFQAATAG